MYSMHTNQRQECRVPPEVEFLKPKPKDPNCNVMFFNMDFMLSGLLQSYLQAMLSAPVRV